MKIKVLFSLALILTFGFFLPTPFTFAAICKATAIGTTTSYQIFAQSSTQQIAATSFSLTDNCSLTAVGVYIAKESTRTQQDAYAQIYSNSSGSPGSVLGTGSSINSINNFDSYAWATSTFQTVIELNAGTTYWVAMNASTTQPQILTWNRSDTGTTKGWDGATWQDGNFPQMTATYNIEGNSTPLGSASPNAADIIFFDF